MAWATKSRAQHASRFAAIAGGRGQADAGGNTRGHSGDSVPRRDGVLRGKGASLLDGYMVATGRIYRLMIAQRMRHSRQAEILDDSGTAVGHTSELIGRLFDEQLAYFKKRRATIRKSRRRFAKRAASVKR
jgi:hypothetical protein